MAFESAFSSEQSSDRWNWFRLSDSVQSFVATWELFAQCGQLYLLQVMLPVARLSAGGLCPAALQLCFGEAVIKCAPESFQLWSRSSRSVSGPDPSATSQSPAPAGCGPPLCHLQRKRNVRVKLVMPSDRNDTRFTLSLRTSFAVTPPFRSFCL